MNTESYWDNRTRGKPWYSENWGNWAFFLRPGRVIIMAIKLKKKYCFNFLSFGSRIWNFLSADNLFYLKYSTWGSPTTRHPLATPLTRKETCPRATMSTTNPKLADGIQASAMRERVLPAFTTAKPFTKYQLWSDCKCFVTIWRQLTCFV
jgi:hypothetical protein